jgi:hypothetical protein
MFLTLLYPFRHFGIVTSDHLVELENLEGIACYQSHVLLERREDLLIVLPLPVLIVFIRILTMLSSLLHQLGALPLSLSRAWHIILSDPCFLHRQ